MRVFISYSRQDRDFVTALANQLRERNIDVVYDDVVLQPGQNMVERLSSALESADALLVVLSQASVQSEWVQAETSTALFSQQIPVLPILIEDCTVPTYLANIVWADFRTDTRAGLDSLVSSLLHIEAGTEDPEKRKDPQQASMEDLATAFREGTLTLVCGAGTSVGAGLPDWATLLTGLLADMFRTDNTSRVEAEQLANQLQERRISSLVVAQYLKSAFGDDFNEKVRLRLYGAAHARSPLIAAIADLCRPRRGMPGLRALITYNFDDLFERELSRLRVAYTSIFEEGQRCAAQSLPIYHAHGFLPSKKEDATTSTLVFAEEAYHSQFLEPFGWANLVQLTELTQSTCLFVGISLTDPNLRRLLDVAVRKGRGDQHYIIWKRTGSGLRRTQHGDQLERRLAVLNEQDANRLGLGVLWVDTYEEIPELIAQLGNGS